MSLSSITTLPVPTNLDIVSDVKFSRTQNQLLVSSWDKKVLLYDCSNIDKVSVLNEFESNSTVLSIVNGKGNSTYVGTVDGAIQQLDYENLKIGPENLGESLNNTPEDAVGTGINNLNNIEGQENMLVASDFSGKLQFIDIRMRSPVLTRRLSNKIFNMDTTNKYLTIGMSERKIEIYDHRNWNQPYQIRESGLKYQIKDLKNFPNGEGFAISSVDGRVAIEYFDPSDEAQSKKFAFKCHRYNDKQSQTDLVYPINSITFNRLNNTLFTAASDGHLCLWNWEKRKRMKQYPRFENNQGIVQSIVKTDISHDYKMLCIATSDDTFKNMKNLSQMSTHPRQSSKLYIRDLK